MKRVPTHPRGLDKLQKISVSLMGVLVLLTFVGANVHALLWQQSAWLVSTVLPAVVVDLTNQKRVQEAAPTLRRNPTLDQAAKLKAQHMAEIEYFSHFSPDGVSPWHWFNEAGYVYAHAGENLAIHFTDSAEVVEAWMDSPAHRANIVDGKYTEIGVGTAKGTYDGYDTVYVVQLFGSPASPSQPTIIKSTEVAVEPSAATSVAEIAAAAEELADAVATLPTTTGEDTGNVVIAEEPAPVQSAETLAATTVEEPVLTDDFISPQAETRTAEPVAESNDVTTSTEAYGETVVVQSRIATSSGLAIASITTPPAEQPAGSTLIALITQPNEVLQLVYMILAMIVMALLLFSAVFEARQLHFVQVSYSFALMLSMGALWYVHNLLTAGAVIT